MLTHNGRGKNKSSNPLLPAKTDRGTAQAVPRHFFIKPAKFPGKLPFCQLFATPLARLPHTASKAVELHSTAIETLS
jgi:hypothetical protein